MYQQMAGAFMGSGGGGQSDSTSFLGGSTGGINFGSYKSTDDKTLIIVGIVALAAVILLRKK
ncbi:MAG: hypothetical protein AAGC78_10355 [Cellvibrio sp.]|uniref:hypothetical protein n=1 Tax=Cellvibrio sp. TaxID=1965322 RepID=UPI0031A8912B